MGIITICLSCMATGYFFRFAQESKKMKYTQKELKLDLIFNDDAR